MSEKKNVFKKFWKKYVTPCIDASCAFHDEHCVTVWNIVLIVGVACVVGWVFLNR